MATFYGTVHGYGRTTAGRQGSKVSGLNVEAMSYSGDVCIRMEHKGDEDYVNIWVRSHGAGDQHCNLFYGKVTDLLNNRQSLLAIMAQRALEQECAA